jgi:predicted porin
MKKTLVALATLAVAGGAFAQTAVQRNLSAGSVEIFGVLDASIVNSTNDALGSRTQMIGDGRNESTRLGFRGLEDLGGGMKASFWLEAGLYVDDGTGAQTTTSNTALGDKVIFGTTAATPYAPSSSLNARQGLTFNRASNISLIHADVGEIRLGRDYMPTFWNYTIYDPFGTVGSGSAMLVNGGGLAAFGAQLPPGAAYPLVRTSNSVGWLSNDYSGFRAQVQMGLSEQSSACAQANNNSLTNSGNQTANGCYGAAGDGKTLGFRISYASGPLTAAFGSSKLTYANVAGQSVTDVGAIPTSSGVGAAGALTGGGAVAALAAVTGTSRINGLANTTNYKGTLDVNNWGISYQVSPALKLAYAGGTQTASATVDYAEKKFTHNMIAATYTIGALDIKGSYNVGKRADGSKKSDGSADAANLDGSQVTQTAVGLVYNLSKRTALYSTYSTQTTTIAGGSSASGSGFVNSFTNTVTAGNKVNATGLDLGMRLRF